MGKRDSGFDERAFLEAMSEGHKFENATKIDPEPSPPRHGDYAATFLQPREPIEKRAFVGLRPELYEVVVTIVRRIGDGVSVQAFVENVLRHHLAEHQDEINRLNRERLKKDIV